MKHFKLITFLLSFLLFINSSLFPAIVADTLIKVSHGLVPVECLSVGDSVVGLKHDGSLVEVKITKIDKKEVNEIYALETDTTVLYFSEKQKLYDPEIKKWVKSKNITTKNVFVDCYGKRHNCLGVKKINKFTVMYELSVEYPHNFFLSDAEILAHNFFGVSLSFAFGLGAAVLTSVRVAFGGLALVLGLKQQTSYDLMYDSNRVLNSIFCKKDKAPGKPKGNDGFRPKKRGDDGRKKKHPTTNQFGWVDRDNNWWIPTGEGSLAHGGVHWDIINKAGRYLGSTYPGGRTR